jgi:5-methylcytosine-specific restriction protein A
MRQLPEWYGATDDTAIPLRVKARIVERHHGQCAKCSRFLRAGYIAFDHIVALCNGGAHAESNLQPLCTIPCHEEKTKDDVATKARNYRRRTKHLGIKKRDAFPTNKSGAYRKKINGQVVPR